MTFDDVMQSLQKRWGVIATLYALGLAGLGLFLRVHLPLSQALLWLGMSGLVGFYILSYLYIHLPDNIPAGELEIVPALGPGAALSLVGGWLIAAMGGFIIIARPQGAVAWLPALLFLGALMADLFDGFLARRSGLATRLGADLDMTLDGLGVLLAAMLAVRWGQWPFWFIIVGLARYLFVWGLAWRRRKGLSVHALEDSVIRRLLAGMQRGFLFVALWPILPAWLTTVTGLAFVIPFLVVFSYDWLVASAVIDDLNPDFRAWLRHWQQLAYGPVALAMRLLTVLLLAVTFWQVCAHPAAFEAALGIGLSQPGLSAPIVLGVGGILALLLLAGVTPRLTAMLLYIPLTLILLSEISYWPALLAFYGLTGIILLGPGPYALWQPEARVFTRRLGS